MIATAHNQRGNFVPVEREPAGVAVTPDGTHVYVANHGANTVSVIGTVFDSVVKTIPVGVHPEGVAVGIIHPR